jgi:hypothetical protein
VVKKIDMASKSKVDGISFSTRDEGNRERREIIIPLESFEKAFDLSQSQFKKDCKSIMAPFVYPCIFKFKRRTISSRKISIHGYCGLESCNRTFILQHKILAESSSEFLFEILETKGEHQVSEDTANSNDFGN